MTRTKRMKISPKYVGKIIKVVDGDTHFTCFDCILMPIMGYVSTSIELCCCPHANPCKKKQQKMKEKDPHDEQR